MIHPPDNYPRILVGTGACGIAAGADQVFEAAKRFVREASQDIHLIRTGCMGMCHMEPILEIHLPGRPRVVYGGTTPENAHALLTQHFYQPEPAPGPQVIGQRPPDDESRPYAGIPPLAEHPFFARQKRKLLAQSGIIDPHSLVDYEVMGGYRAIRKALGMGPQKVIDEVRRAGLKGRGGGGFSTGDKWALAARQADPVRFVIANGDEGDPGAFSDRSLLEGNPHLILEGLMIAGFATSAERGYVYTRASYPTAIHRLEVAIAFCRKRSYLGHGIFGSGFNFDIHIRKGSGAYICGEETALIATLEGGPPMPRSKPPRPAESGYLGHPTVVNNIETLASVPGIVLEGAEAYRMDGTAGSPGTKLLSLSGAIRRSGVVEVPFGITLREVVFGIGGGVREGARFKAVLMGGPDGGFLPEHLLDTPVDFEALSGIGSTLGSGGLVVVDDTTCMVSLARYFEQFEADASCGKCTPCRIGTLRLVEQLDRIRHGQGTANDLATLTRLCDVVREGSLCGLGRAAPTPVTTALTHFMDDFTAHLAGHCPTGSCEPPQEEPA